MIDSMISPLSILFLAVSILINAAVTFMARPTKRRGNVVSDLKVHNQTLDNLLENKETRELLAELTAREGMLLGFIEEVEKSIDPKMNPVDSAIQVANEEPQDKEGFFKRQWSNVREFGKPVAETVFGKANGYIKKYVGGGDSDEA